MLNHEFDHAVRYEVSPEKFIKDSKTLPEDDFHTKEEYRVISGSERKTAESLGEISLGEVTRFGHSGIRIQTESSDSNTPKDINDIKFFEIEIYNKEDK